MVVGWRGIAGALLPVLVGTAGCIPGPSDERLSCLNGCGRAKDDCVLRAMTAPAVQACDWRGKECSATCPPH